METIRPCLWFDNQAEDAARFYTSVFKNSRIINSVRYGKEGFEIHKRPEGSVMTVEFDLNGQIFTALNGGRHSSSMRPCRSRFAATLRRK